MCAVSLAGWANRDNGSYTITHSSFANNAAGYGGGAIYDDAITPLAAPPTNINASTFALNSATDRGGAVFYLSRDGNMVIVNSTFSGNDAGDEGGAIYHNPINGSMTIANATFSGNAAVDGATIWTGESLTMNNSIVSDSDDPDTVDPFDGLACAGTGLIVGRGNLVGSDSDPNFDFDGSCGPFNTFAGVGVTYMDALADKGGPRVGAESVALETHALLIDSNAIGVGWDNCPNPADPLNNSLTVDQLDNPRPGGGDGCDVGAFELQ